MDSKKGRPSAKLERIEQSTGHSIVEILRMMAARRIGTVEAAERLRLSRSYVYKLCREHEIKMGTGRRGKGGPPAEAREAAAEARRVLVTMGGKTLSIADWAEELGITYAQMRWRLARWPLENVLAGKAPERAGYGTKRVKQAPAEA